MKLAARAVLFALMSPVLMSAAGTVDGNWAGRSDSDHVDAKPLQLFVKTEGTTLTGRITNDAGWFDIENGSVAGDLVTFNAVTAVEGGTSVLAFTCTGPLVEETIDLSCSMPNGSQKRYMMKPFKGA